VFIEPGEKLVDPTCDLKADVNDGNLMAVTEIVGTRY